MTAFDLEQVLSGKSKLKVDLVYNDNRTTMVSILEKKRKYIRLSIHQMFKKASEAVVEALVDFIHNHKKRDSSALLQDYINKNLSTYRYDQKLDPSKLVSLGQVHDLKLLYHRLNRKYFNNALDLQITWFGQGRKKKGCQMTYGLYVQPLRLIKIHRLLDRRVCPEFYIEYVIFHEMLHELHKPYKGASCTHIHTPEFRAHEKLFNDYERAIAWEKKSRHLFFR